MRITNHDNVNKMISITNKIKVGLIFEKSRVTTSFVCKFTYKYIISDTQRNF